MMKLFLLIVLSCTFAITLSASNFTTAIQHTDALNCKAGICVDPDDGTIYCGQVDFYFDYLGDLGFYVVCSGDGGAVCPATPGRSGLNGNGLIDNTDIMQYAVLQIRQSNNLTGIYYSNLIVGNITFYRSISWSATSDADMHFNLIVTTVTP